MRDKGPHDELPLITQEMLVVWGPQGGRNSCWLAANTRFIPADLMCLVISDELSWSIAHAHRFIIRCTSFVLVQC